MMLWHYCPNEAFQKIVQYEKLRFSDLQMSNDRHEGLMLQKAIERIANMLETPKNQKLIDIYLGFQGQIEWFESKAKGIGFCFSSIENDLGQWILYGDGGHGISFGVDEDIVRSLPDELPNDGTIQHGIMLLNVRYRVEELEEKVAVFLTSLIGQKPKEIGDRVYQFIGENLYLWKPGGFKNEKEVRLMSGYSVGTKPDLDVHDIDLNARKDALVAYRDYSLATIKGNFIRKVVLGPKNRANPKVLQHWLERRGFGDVKVSVSDIPYI